MANLATSTTAMTIYNVLAIRGRSAAALEIAVDALKFKYLIPEDEFDRAMRGLVQRGYVRVEQDRFDVVDPQRRIVRARDRSDEGTEEPGWNGWLVMSLAGRDLASLDAIVEARR